MRLFDDPRWYERRVSPRPYVDRPVPVWQRPEYWEDDWRESLLAELEAECGPRQPFSEFGAGELSLGALALDDSSSAYVDDVPEMTERELAAAVGVSRRDVMLELARAGQSFRRAWRREGDPTKGGQL